MPMRIRPRYISNKAESELSKLKIKIQNNEEMLVSKDRLIQKLLLELKSNNQSLPRPDEVPPNLFPNLSIKINDIETKFSTLIKNQLKLEKSIAEIGVKAQAIQKGLLSILACKMANMQGQINIYLEKSQHRFSHIEMTFASKMKNPQSSFEFKSQQISPNNARDTQSALHWLSSLREQVNMFKMKQFRYENPNIIKLDREIGDLKAIVIELQKKFSSAQFLLKNSRSKKGFQSQRKNNNNNSCFFDDYEEENYEDVDSIGEDQFFHPLEESTKRYYQNTQSPKQIHSPKPTTSLTHIQQFRQKSVQEQKPSLHNDSFQNFTSQQQDDDSPNIKRLSKTLKEVGYKLPLPIQVDLSGYIRKKADQRYLLDREKKGFVLTSLQLNVCKSKGMLIW